jgi:hypothetical protein
MRKHSLAAAICLSTLTAGAAEAGSIGDNLFLSALLNRPQTVVSQNMGLVTVAGVLGYTELSGSDFEGFDDYLVEAKGSRILFAELKAATYQSRGKGHDGHEEPSDETMASEGGCGDDGGPGGTCLQLLDAHDNVLCWAERPKHPGWWGGDPSMACILEYPRGSSQRMTIRVSLADEDCSDLVYPLAPFTDSEEPFALPYRLRMHTEPMATEGSRPGLGRGMRERF